MDYHIDVTLCILYHQSGKVTHFKLFELACLNTIAPYADYLFFLVFDEAFLS